MPTISAIKNTLNGLGTKRSPDQIAAFLALSAIKGVRNGGDNGILARYLIAMSLFEEGQELDGFQFSDVQDAICYVPRSVGIFVDLFDNGKYLMLEE